MKKSDNSKFIKLFLGVFLSLLVLCITVVACVDPFFVYRIGKNSTSYIYDQEYSPTWKVGISRHQYGYDSIWVGSSLSTYVDTDYLKSTMGYNCTTGIIASGRPNIYKLFIEEAIKDNNIKTVFYETVITHWVWEGMGTDYNMSIIPQYVMTDSFLDDGDYLLNKDVLGESLIDIQRSIDFFIKRIKMKDTISSEEDIGVNDGKTEEQNQIIPHDAVFSIKSMAPRIATNTIQYVNDDTLMYYESIGKGNIENNIIPLIKNNPDVQFVFVIPPTGVMFYAQLANADLLETFLGVEERLFTILLSFDNVRMICANLDVEFNSDLNNYMDDGHFCPQGAYNEIDYIKDGKYELTIDNIHETLLQYIDMTNNFEWPFLKEGFIGNDVKELQDMLINLGYEIDEYGVYGSLTRDAIADFQQKNEIDVTGIAFDETINAIRMQVN